MKPNIELHIDELVLHGFDHGDGHRVGEAVEKELTRLLTEQGLPVAESIDIERLDGGSCRFSPVCDARAVGRVVAESIHKGLQATAKPYMKG